MLHRRSREDVDNITYTTKRPKIGPTSTMLAEDKRRDVGFRTLDGVTLRGWFYPSGSKAPCVILAHGFSCIKEMFLDCFAERFQKAGYAVLVYDNRNFGDSDGYPRYEADPVVQAADYSDAITYVCSLTEDVESSRIAVWGTSYSGGVVLRVGAVDRRLKAVISQVPLTSGYECSKRWTRPDDVSKLYKLVYDDRATRVAGKKPGEIPVVDPMLFGTAALPTLESHKWYTEVGMKKAPSWVNSVTIQSIFNVWGNEPVSYAALVSPTPLLMLVAEKDVLCGTDLQLEAFQRAKEPKQLALLRDGAGHFDCYQGEGFERCVGAQVAFLKKYL